MINFDNTTNTWPMQMVGRLDGENAIKDGEGFYFTKMKLWRDTPFLQYMYPTVNKFITSIVKMKAKQYREERRQQNPVAPPNSYEKDLFVN